MKARKLRSPSISALATGGFEVAFQSNAGVLWTVGSAGNTNWSLGVTSGTSPSIAGMTSSGWKATWNASVNDLWTLTSGGTGTNLSLSMAAGTSPSITALPGRWFRGGFPGQYERPLDRRDGWERHMERTRPRGRYKPQHRRHQRWQLRDGLSGTEWPTVVFFPLWHLRVPSGHGVRD